MARDILNNKLIEIFLAATGKTYARFLKENLIPFLDEVNLNKLQNTWFIHNGAPAHFCSNNVKRILNEKFNNRWIACGRPIE